MLAAGAYIDLVIQKNESLCKLVGCPAYDGTERQEWFMRAKNVTLCDREYLLKTFSPERMGSYEYAYPRAHPINIITAAYASKSLSAPREQTPRLTPSMELQKFHTKCLQDQRSTCALGSTNSVNRGGRVLFDINMEANICTMAEH